jgi:hypothetical protein
MYEAEYYYPELGITDLMEVIESMYEGKTVTTATGTITILETTANQGPKQDCLAESSHFHVYSSLGMRRRPYSLV